MVRLRAAVLIRVYPFSGLNRGLAVRLTNDRPLMARLLPHTEEIPTSQASLSVQQFQRVQDGRLTQ